MNEHLRAMVLASFAADALSMAAHWIYDTNKIDRDLGIVDHMLTPAPDSYHGNKTKGDFTHYGDQTLLLLQHLAENSDFNQQSFAHTWKDFSSSYTGYIDNASKQTLACMNDNKMLRDCGSNSSDLGGPARIAPLVYRYRDNPEKLMTTAQEQAALTHKGAGIIATTDFLVRVMTQVIGGKTPAEAICIAIDDGVSDIDLDMRLRNSLETTAMDSRDAIGQFGQMCGTSAALPGAMHLVLTYQDNLQEALIQNVMAGGDSAARGLVVGMVVGAYQGMDGLNDGWLRDMRATAAITEYLDKIHST